VQGSVLIVALPSSIGKVVATPGALALLADADENPAELLAWHQDGDRGFVLPEDARENYFTVSQGFRILSSCQVDEGSAQPSRSATQP
jgi:hypothetical protein